MGCWRSNNSQEYELYGEFEIALYGNVLRRWCKSITTQLRNQIWAEHTVHRIGRACSLVGSNPTPSNY